MFDVTPPSVSTTLSGLEPYTNYSCNVRASTSVGEGTPSGTDIALTDETSKIFNVTVWLESVSLGSYLYLKSLKVWL